MSYKKKVVVLTGAGISQESGIKTFRDGDGLWENHRVEEVATPEAFIRNPKLVLDFYNHRRKQLHTVKPNAAHYFFKELEELYDVSIITQNIDDLQERAGSSHVLHLHGELKKARSVKNDTKLYINEGDIHLGDKALDGGQLRPHVVWFGEAVPEMVNAIQLVEQADIFIIVGTSLQVYPAASLVDYAPPKAKKYLIDPSSISTRSDITIYAKKATEGVEDLRKELI